MEKHENKRIIYGYVAEPIKINEDYVFGSVLSPTPKTILQPNGDWTEFLPTDEYQNLNRIETQACTSFGTLNCVEILIKRVMGQQFNYSDRWSAWNSGTTATGGNTPQRVAETLRKTGVPFQGKWDFTPDIDTPEKFYQNPPVKLFDDAKKDFSFSFSHEYVPSSKEMMLQALKLSPLGIAVSAWNVENGIYISAGMPNNHWVCCYGFDKEKDAFKVFDSYDGSRKLYKGDISVVKRYSVDKVVDCNTRLWFSKIKNFLWR